MKVYLLVHGAWQGSGCWEKVASKLQAAGHFIITPELPWDNYIDKDDRYPFNVCIDHLVETIQDYESIIAVGHSIGGIFISQLAEAIPDRIVSLVFISGFLIPDGQCANDTASLMSDSLASRNMSLSKDKNNIVLSKKVLRDALYNDISDEDYLFAEEQYCDQPLWTFQTPVSLTESRFGGIPKFYIECLKDNAIPVSAQRVMQESWKCQKTYSLNCSHSPFYSMPDELAGILEKL